MLPFLSKTAPKSLSAAGGTLQRSLRPPSFMGLGWTICELCIPRPGILATHLIDQCQQN